MPQFYTPQRSIQFPQSTVETDTATTSVIALPVANTPVVVVPDSTDGSRTGFMITNRENNSVIQFCYGVLGSDAAPAADAPWMNLEPGESFNEDKPVKTRLWAKCSAVAAIGVGVLSYARPVN